MSKNESQKNFDIRLYVEYRKTKVKKKIDIRHHDEYREMNVKTFIFRYSS